MTAADVADATCIRMTLIREIEQDRFAACGGDVYARGHIRAIAAAVGVDPAPLVAYFDRKQGRAAPAAPVASAARAAPPAVARPVPLGGFAPAGRRPERHGPNWTAGMALALAVVAVIAAVAYFKPAGGTSPGDQRAGSVPSQLRTPDRPAAGTSATAQTATPPSATAQPTESAGAPPGVVAQAHQTGVDVVVRITDQRSWLHVSNAAGDDLFTGVLEPGTTREFTDTTQVRMTIGYPPSVDLAVNGHEVGVTGGPDQVTHVTFGPGDPVGSGA